jgi:xanthine dehydrogenase YagT iron-sulfur-binding subunit
MTFAFASIYPLRTLSPTASACKFLTNLLIQATLGGNAFYRCELLYINYSPSQSMKNDTAVLEAIAEEKRALPEYETVTLSINGQSYKLKLQPWVSLLDAIREYIGLTGTKKGCDHGQCGACTVLVNGKRINSCMTLAVMKDGAQITTIEGLAEGQINHPLQDAFIEHDAFQCGYCTPGQICSAVGMFNEGRAETLEDVQELMSGNICRCGAYNNINAAIMEVKSKMA